MKLLAILAMLACLPAVALSQHKPKSEKERLIYPAEITINAPAAKIRSLIMAGYLRDGYQLDSETASSVTFSQRGGLRYAFAYGSMARIQTTLTFVEADGVTLVIADMGVLSPNRVGGYERFNRNSDKSSRKALESFLKGFNKSCSPIALCRTSAAFFCDKQYFHLKLVILRNF